MAPAWTPLEDRALLLALIQSMAPEGPSKHQFEAAVKAAGGRWTFGAVSQHYNKKLRSLSPLDGLDARGDSPGTPAKATPKRRRATPARAASLKTPPADEQEDDHDDEVEDEVEEESARKKQRKGKKVAKAPVFPNLGKGKKEVEVEKAEGEGKEDGEEE